MIMPTVLGGLLLLIIILFLAMDKSTVKNLIIYSLLLIAVIVFVGLSMVPSSACSSLN